MEKINILLGEGSATKEKVNRLLDGAIKFYGPKYEQLVLQTVREAIFCEYEKEETVNDILPKVFEVSENLKGGRLNLNFSNILKAKKVGACLIVNRTMDGNEQIVITKNTTKRNDYHILAHELFGHAVCGKEKLIVEEDGKDDASMRQIDESLKKLWMLSSSKILFPVKNRLKKKIYTNLDIVQKNLTR